MLKFSHDTKLGRSPTNLNVTAYRIRVHYEFNSQMIIYSQRHYNALHCIAERPVCLGPEPMCGMEPCDQMKYDENGCMLCECVDPSEACEVCSPSSVFTCNARSAVLVELFTVGRLQGNPCPISHQCIFDLPPESWEALREIAPDARRVCVRK